MKVPHWLPILVGVVCLSSWASAAEPRINRLEPQGVRRGGEATVKLVGARLGQEPQEVVLDAPGLTVSKLETVDKNVAQATLTVAEDCPLGRHAVRLRTSTGLSNLVTLHVGALESVDEVEPNNTVEAAQETPLERTVHGVVTPEDEDVFAVDVAEGQRLSVEVEGLRMGRTFFDPVIEVLDAEGKLVAKNDDQPAAYQDAFLSLVAPSAGKYYVRLRESAFRGNNQSTYLLHIGSFPRPTAVYPPAAVAGQDIELRWIGDAKGDFTTKAAAPADAGATYYAEASDGAGFAPSTPPLAVVAAPPTLEAEPNQNNDQATPMTVPGAAAGVVQEAGDRDRFRFTAKKDQTLDLRVRARELRSGLDAILRVYNAKGKQLAANDDDRGNPDSYLRFKAPADGDYFAQIDDRLGRGDESLVYLLDVTAPSPVADLKLYERRRYEATHLEVPQGGRTAVYFTVGRKDFGGELELLLDSLPQGVRAESFSLPGDYNVVPVVLHADEDAPLASSLSPVTVRRTGTDNPIEIDNRFEQQHWMVRGRNNVSVWSHYTDSNFVTVTKRLPFKLSLDEPRAPLCRNGNRGLRVTVERDEGFDKPIRVYTLYHPPGFSSNRSLSIGKGETEKVIPCTANGNARTGGWPMAVVGEVGVNGRVFASTQFVTLSVAEDYFDLSVPTVTAIQGEPAEMVVSLSHRTPFEGAAKLELVGLPPGVTAEPVEVAAGAESATFKITVAADAKTGPHRGVGVRVRLQVEGEQVEYRQGYAELRVDPRPAEQTASRKEADGGSKA